MKTQPARRPTPHYLIRGHSVTLDFDLAADYGLTTREVNQTVKRNRSRFPEDFLFQLTDDEFRDLRSQQKTASLHLRNCRYRPYAFNIPGYLMLLSLLTSDFAIRTFTRILRHQFH